MDKKTFISELKQALSVLQEDELNDIISEYEQHIDMKQERGLTEEEAIADFGGLNELTAEILEAYHVRADYASGHRNKKKGMMENQGVHKLFGQAKKKCAGAGAFIIDGAGRLKESLTGVLLFWGQLLSKSLHFIRKKQPEPYRLEAFENMGQEDKAEELMTGGLQNKEESGQKHGKYSKNKAEKLPKTGKTPVLNGIRIMVHKGMEFLAAAVRLIIYTFFWGIRMVWNGFCVGIALCLSGFGVFCLFFLGMLVVLLLQHYPLAGVTLGCMGLVACSFSAAGLAVSFIKKREKPDRGEDACLETEDRQDA